MIVLGALALGLGIGVLTGLFGVGGGFLITPLLNILLGIPMPLAVGASAVQILGVSTAGLYRRHGAGQTDYKMAIVLFGGNYVGVRLGAATLGWLNNVGELRLVGRAVAAVEFVILCVFLLLLTGIAAWIWYDTSQGDRQEKRSPGLLVRVKLPPYTSFPTLGTVKLSIIAASYFGVVLGFLTGLLGIGGGVILVPALIYLFGMGAHQAAATSLAMVWLSSFAATITHASIGNVDLLLTTPLLIGGTIGVQIGTSVCSRLSDRQLCRYFVFVVLAATLTIAAKLAVLLW